jgi:hypothetical protein
MRRIQLILAVFALTCLTAHAQAQSNFCMDCIENQVQHVRADGSIWFESDGMCCMVPCYGYLAYDIDEEDVGSGCNTTVVNNELVQGDICNSMLEDQGCPNLLRHPVAMIRTTAPAATIRTASGAARRF